MEERKIMKTILGSTMRSIVTQANELGIQREDIVQMFNMGGQIYLVYYN